MDARTKLLTEAIGLYEVIGSMPTSRGDFGLHYGFDDAIEHAISFLTDEQCEEAVAMMEWDDDEEE